MFVVGTELFVFSPLLPMLAADYHNSVGMAGLTVTVFSLTYMCSAPLFGHLSDRVGCRRILICALFAFGAANFLTALAANLPSLLAIRACAGAAAAGISPSIYALVGAAAPPHRRATWLALAVSGLLASLAFGAAAGALVGALCGWPTIFVALGAFSWVLVGLNGRVWPSEHDHGDGAPRSAPDPIPIAILARRLIPMVVWSTGLYGVYTYLGTGLGSFGFSTGQTAKAILVYGCGAIAGVLLGGRSADRLGIKFTACSSFAGLCACLLLLRMALNAGALVVLALGVSSAVAQLFFPAHQAGLANDFPQQRGAALAWNNSALFLGISLGSLLGGKVFALGSFEANLTISAGIALIGCVIVAVVVPGRDPVDATAPETPDDGTPRRIVRTVF